MSVYLYQSDSYDGWRNLATDRFFLEHLNENNILLYLYINENAVIIGKNQNALRECDLSAMEKDSVQLVRRHTGGGAVYHDRGNLNFSFIMSEEHYDLTRQFGIIQKALARLGLDAALSGRNDLLIGDKKFSGNAFAASKGMKAHHGTILIDADLSRLEKYLNVSSKKLNAKGVTSVRARVCNLRELSDIATVSMVAELLKQEFAREYGEYGIYNFTEEQKAALDELYTMQSSWDWRFGKAPAFDYQVEERFSFGEMQLLFSVKQGLVQDVSVFSDALDTSLSDDVRACLKGMRFTPSHLAESLMGSSKPELLEIAEHLKSISF
ncbi:MAG: lipoate--protein ligase [Clostridia bacterium]|nr:lipoate--protein ligase [Clostridia bacterium]